MGRRLQAELARMVSRCDTNPTASSSPPGRMDRDPRERDEEFGRTESWPFDGVADLLVVNPVFAVVAREFPRRAGAQRTCPTPNFRR